MRAFYRVPVALWEDAEASVAAQCVACGRTSASVYAMAAERLPTIEEAGAVYLGDRISAVSTGRKHFQRTRVERLTEEGASELLLHPDDVQVDDFVLEEGLPAMLFSGDTPEDVL